ncbi:hypothetical protein LTR56_004854 [Elasticomyces elasticus]|nr:hypothetical protein LTR56_004854 [Elasticomyces elasticus]KAK3664628.1 hypothetical protein LTR22_004496 [Elasticomyces elasticus]KAK4918404.1 hypothetical protein LTR49_013796 [Elasticomyces elasticus]KAK5760338.1 hypothetical protein LTS12_009552 [Elasticomyces elasticus]
MRSATQATLLTRLLPLLASFPPCLFSLLLLAQTHHYYGHALTSLVSSNRTTVQILVFVLSYVLGLLQLYSLRTTFTYAARLLAFQGPIHLEKMRYWSAISTNRFDLLLPAHHQLICVLLLATSFLPGTLWTGALTPLLELHTLPTKSSIKLPTFSQNSSDSWNNTDLENCQTVGLVTTCPVPDLQGALLTTLGSASTAGSSLMRRHAKIDAPDWSYVGRSYGVGSSVGLTWVLSPGDAMPVVWENGLTAIQYKDEILGVRYEEYGWFADVRCEYNRSTGYVLQSVADGPGGLDVYAAQGFLPNSFDEGAEQAVRENYTVVSRSNETILAWSARNTGNRTFLSMATNSGNSGFNRTQCVIAFLPTMFTVSTNMSSREITVTPTTRPDMDDTRLPDITVTANAVRSLDLLPRVSSSSALNDALDRNMWNAVSEVGHVMITERDRMSSVEDALAAVLDDILGAYGAAQVVFAHDTAETDVTVVGMMIRVGVARFVHLVAGFSVVVVVMQVVGLAWTRCWDEFSVALMRRLF